MKQVTLLFAVCGLFLSGATFAANTADVAQRGDEASVAAKPALEVAVYMRDARGALSNVGWRMTHGEPVQFSERFSYLVATNGAHDAYDGHWSMTISDFRDSVADSFSFDVSMEGKDPGVWEGQATQHVRTETGSRTNIVHGIDGKDYVIELRRVNG